MDVNLEALTLAPPVLDPQDLPVAQEADPAVQLELLPLDHTLAPLQGALLVADPVVQLEPLPLDHILALLQAVLLVADPEAAQQLVVHTLDLQVVQVVADLVVALDPPSHQAEVPLQVLTQAQLALLALQKDTLTLLQANHSVSPPQPHQDLLVDPQVADQLHQPATQVPQADLPAESQPATRAQALAPAVAALALLSLAQDPRLNSQDRDLHRLATQADPPALLLPSVPESLVHPADQVVLVVDQAQQVDLQVGDQAQPLDPMVSIYFSQFSCALQYALDVAMVMTYEWLSGGVTSGRPGGPPYESEEEGGNTFLNPPGGRPGSTGAPSGGRPTGPGSTGAPGGGRPSGSGSTGAPGSTGGYPGTSSTPSGGYPGSGRPTGPSSGSGTSSRPGSGSSSGRPTGVTPSAGDSCSCDSCPASSPGGGADNLPKDSDFSSLPGAVVTNVPVIFYPDCSANAYSRPAIVAYCPATQPSCSATQPLTMKFPSQSRAARRSVVRRARDSSVYA